MAALALARHSYPAGQNCFPAEPDTSAWPSYDPEGHRYPDAQAAMVEAFALHSYPAGHFWRPVDDVQFVFTGWPTYVPARHSWPLEHASTDAAFAVHSYPA